MFLKVFKKDIIPFKYAEKNISQRLHNALKVFKIMQLFIMIEP